MKYSRNMNIKSDKEKLNSVLIERSLDGFMSAFDKFWLTKEPLFNLRRDFLMTYIKNQDKN